MSGVKLVRDVRIPTLDGETTLSADLYLPDVESQVPALVSVMPYRKDALGGLGGAATLRWFAEHGYASLLVDLRGTGSSGGSTRAPFDPDEADDGIAAIDWSAQQPWCTGHVGMWGHSYGAALTLRTAARRPEQLRAIMPVMGFLDPERDFVHPGGARGCLASFGVWGLGTLHAQVLPPVHAHYDADEQRRWLERLDQSEPYVLDAFRHEPGHPVWRTRIIDATTIEAPSLCIAGWRDMFCDATLRAYEDIRAPKKLLVGPWMHTLPHESPFDPVDFLALALRWWDRWLADIDNGIDREPAVTVHIQGAAPTWRNYGSWPPPGKTLVLAAATGATLSPASALPPRTEVGPVIASAPLDPTVGARSGLWGIPTSGYGLPLDQHADDTASLSVTGAPLDRPVLLIGRPSVSLTLASGGGPRPLVIKLADVDPDGRSTLITGGVLAADNQPIDLDPTGYRLDAGHRLRVIVAGGAFPRLWPPASGSGSSDGVPPARMLHLYNLRLSLPTVTVAEGEPAALFPPDASPGAAADPWLAFRPRWNIDRDLIDSGVTVTVGGSLAAYTPEHEQLFENDIDISTTVGHDAPDAARLHGTSTATVHLRGGEILVVRVELRLTRTAVAATGHVGIDGVTIASRQWHAISD
jgi:putative CocE/NonD family hydrolase